jgi:hypothetical protein
MIYFRLRPSGVFPLCSPFSSGVPLLRNMWISSTCPSGSNNPNSLHSSRLYEYYPLLHANILKFLLAKFCIFRHLSPHDGRPTNWLRDFDKSSLLCTLITSPHSMILDCTRPFSFLATTLCTLTLILLRFFSA